MEAIVFFRSPQLLAKTADFNPRTKGIAGHSSLDGGSLHSAKLRFCFVSRMKEKKWTMKRGIRADMNSHAGPSDHSSSSSQLAPLHFESSVGQFLSQILLSHPHLVPAAVDQQLEQLLIDLEAEKKQVDPNSTGNDLILYRRIAEVKAKERNIVLEEILYALVVQKFVDAKISLVPSMPQSLDEPNKVGHWQSWEEKFERLHSSEAFEMIRNHLSVILGNRIDDSSSIASISKLRVGQVYAASILYGYFLKRVDRRFQLEKVMKTLPKGSGDEGLSPKGTSNEEDLSTSESSTVSSSHPTGFADRVKPCRLRTYVISLDSETLQRFATLRSKEAFSIIEKHREALFGSTEISITAQGKIDSSKEELLKISFAGLKRLILEAVTFGSFLWEVESYVDSRYHFVA